MQLARPHEPFLQYNSCDYYQKHSSIQVFNEQLTRTHIPNAFAYISGLGRKNFELRAVGLCPSLKNINVCSIELK